MKLFSSSLVRASVAALLLADCLDPTEIVLHISTDVACSVVTQNSIGIAVEEPGSETSAFSTVTKDCAGDGGVGSLALTPSGGIGDQVGVRVVLGVNTPTSQCAPTYSGCIVARRSLRYSPHTPLTLPIDLEQSCVDKPCDPTSTCVNGACVDAGTTCSDGVCGVADAGSPPDAGGCTPVGPITIASQVAGSSPHIARFPGGYAITYEGAPTQLHGLMIDEAGKPIAPDTLLVTNTATGYFGPMGSNGSTYLITRFNGATLATDMRDTTGVGKSNVVLAALPGIAGVLYDYANAHYVFPSAPTTATSNLSVYDLAQGSAPTVAGTIASANATYVSLAQGEPTSMIVALTTPAAECQVFKCAYDGQKLTCPPMTPWITTNCTSARLAANAAHVFSVFNAGALVITVDGVLQTSYATVLDNVESMSALTHDANNFRVVWRSGGVLSTTTFPTAAAVSPLTPVLNFPGDGPGFDSVADDPSTQSWAVVYYQADGTGQNIRFARFCN